MFKVTTNGYIILLRLNIIKNTRQWCIVKIVSLLVDIAVKVLALDGQGTRKFQASDLCLFKQMCC